MAQIATTERGTGTPDRIYNLVSVLYHALDGAQVYERYIQDAEREGDPELTLFFREVRDANRQRAERAKQLLLPRLLKYDVRDAVDEASMESFPASDAPAHRA